MTIADNLNIVRQAVDVAQKDTPVKLVAVSKTFPEEAIWEAYQAGQRIFGENYVQEGVRKIQYFRDAQPQAEFEWHFIGPLQSNKSRHVAEHFDWVQSIDRLKIARRLSEQRPSSMPALNVLIEVNIDDEETKSGVAPDDLLAIVKEVAVLRNLKLRGLMCIPSAQADEAQSRAAFAKMKSLFEFCRKEGFDFDTLSMGMSADFALAIDQGATMVRVGSAIFGARDYSNL